MFDIDKLSEENWLDEAIKIYSSLKPEIQGSNGLLKKLRKLNEESSFVEKLNARKNFLDKDIRMLDDSVNQYISALYTINARNLNRLNFDFLQVLRLADLGDCPNLSVVIDTLNSKNYHGLLGERICLILAKIAKMNPNDAVDMIVQAKALLHTGAGLNCTSCGLSELTTIDESFLVGFCEFVML